jgi:hypothetical protein
MQLTIIHVTPHLSYTPGITAEKSVESWHHNHYQQTTFAVHLHVLYKKYLN